ncbi:helix-turn-helix domain-containing protein [Rhodococcus sp. NPDC059968]|uniref:helix-turn-helix domain-containing protein n=1 Tax=Rhodococcus sp. NPDC059968 TaxID=3347017 RepID=UPI00366DB5AF
MLERQRIATLRAAGHSIRGGVARQLGRSASTVNRELQRNTVPHNRGCYDATLAHSRATGRSIRPRQDPSTRRPGSSREGAGILELEWSPK